MDSEYWERISEIPGSGIRKVQGCLSFENSTLGKCASVNSLKKTVKKDLRGRLNRYEKELDGVLVGYGKMAAFPEYQTDKVKASSLRQEVIGHKLKGQYFVFQPRVGEQLNCTVCFKTSNMVRCLVHNKFEIVAKKPLQLDEKNWTGACCNISDEVVVEVVSVHVDQGVLQLVGRFPQFIATSGETCDFYPTDTPNGIQNCLTSSGKQSKTKLKGKCKPHKKKMSGTQLQQQADALDDKVFEEKLAQLQKRFLLDTDDVVQQENQRTDGKWAHDRSEKITQKKKKCDSEMQDDLDLDQLKSSLLEEARKMYGGREDNSKRIHREEERAVKKRAKRKSFRQKKLETSAERSLEDLTYELFEKICQEMGNEDQKENAKRRNCTKRTEGTSFKGNRQGTQKKRKKLNVFHDVKQTTLRLLKEL